jgi:hypothetical protein
MLVTCTGCGRKISSSARACPGCGTLPPRFVYCTKCGKSILGTAPDCPFCGAARYRRAGRSSGIVLWLAGAIALYTMALIGIRYLSRHESPASSSLSCSSPAPSDIEVHLEYAGRTVTDPLGETRFLVALEDKGNNDVCASGTLTATVYSYFMGWGAPILAANEPIYSGTWEVDARDFSVWKFKHEASEEKNEQRLMWFSGRIPYSKFVAERVAGGAQINVVFRLRNGVALEGKSRIFDMLQWNN